MTSAARTEDMTTSVTRELQAGRSDDDILANLRARGLSERSARGFLERAKLQRAAGKPESPAGEAGRTPEREENGRWQIVGGAFWFSLGVVVTGASYLFAEPGGKYVLAYGAIVFGLVDLARGFGKWTDQPEPFPWLGASLAALAPVAGLVAILIGASVTGYVHASREKAAAKAAIAAEQAAAKAERARDARMLVEQAAQAQAERAAAQEAEALEQARQLLAGPPSTSRTEAWCNAAALVGTKDPDAARPQLLAQLQGADNTDMSGTRVRFCSAQALAALGELDVVVAFHLANIGSGDQELRSQSLSAMGALGARGHAAVPALIEDLTSPRLNARVTAVQALGDIGPGARGAVTALRAALNDADAFVRDAAALALKKIEAPGLATAEATPPPANQHPTKTAVDPAALLAARQRIEAPFSLSEPQQWCAAASLLGAQDPTWARPHLMLVVLKHDQHTASYPMKYFCAADALAAMGDVDAALQFHMVNIDSGDERLRRQSLMEVAKLGPRAAPAVPALMAELSNDNFMFKVFAIDSLAKIGPASAPAVPALKSLLNDRNPAVRDAAARALRKIGMAS